MFFFCIGPGRGKMKECYHQTCDSVRNGHRGDFANMDFYYHTVQALLDTTLDISNSKCRNNYFKKASSFRNLRSSSARLYFNSHLMVIMLITLIYFASI